MAIGVRFLQLLKPQTLEEQRAQHAYIAQVQRVSERICRVFDDWNARREVEADEERLANTAAVNRWELMVLAREAEEFVPPRSMLNIHRNLDTTLKSAARACQLLASGYRSHKAHTVCDGQALLIQVVGDVNALVAQLQTR